MTKKPQEYLKDYLLDVKEIIGDLNEFAIKHKVFIDDPTAILNLSCMCDELIGIIEK